MKEKTVDVRSTSKSKFVAKKKQSSGIQTNSVKIKSKGGSKILKKIGKTVAATTDAKGMRVAFVDGQVLMWKKGKDY